MEYKGFYIQKNNSKWLVFNSNGQLIKSVKTKKEAIEKIDNQTI